MSTIEPKKTRKRLFRRTSFSKAKSPLDELQIIIDEANEYLMKIAELERGLSAPTVDQAEVARDDTGYGRDGGVESVDIEASMRRLDEALAFLREIAGLDDVPAEHMLSQGQVVDSQGKDRGIDTEASMRRLDEALAFLREIAGLEKEPADKIMATKLDVSIRMIERKDKDDGDDKLWDEFVTERAAMAVNKDMVKMRKPKGRMARIVRRLFGGSKRKSE